MGKGSMYLEHYGFHYARSRQQELLAEAVQARLIRLARAARSHPAPHAPTFLNAKGSAGLVGCAPAARGTSPWRRPAMWLGTLLVRWGEALLIRAGPPETVPEASMPW